MSNEPNAAAVDAAHDAIMSIMTEWLAETIDEKALARAAVEAMTAWRPIETAPKQGRALFGFHGQFHWMPFTGECGTYWSIGKADVNYATPTHWMPLPPAPAKEPEQ